MYIDSSLWILDTSLSIKMEMKHHTVLIINFITYIIREIYINLFSYRFKNHGLILSKEACIVQSSTWVHYIDQFVICCDYTISLLFILSVSNRKNYQLVNRIRRRCEKINHIKWLRDKKWRESSSSKRDIN